MQAEAALIDRQRQEAARREAALAVPLALPVPASWSTAASTVAAALGPARKHHYRP